MNEERLVLILGFAGFVVIADNWVVSPILPAIAQSIHVSPIRAGLLISAYMLPFGLFQLLFGPLADRYGKRQVITFSMAFFTIVTGLCSLGVGLYDLALYRAVTGMFAASVFPISVALIADMVPMERRQEAIATFMGIAFLGQGLSMVMGGAIAYFVSWRGVFVTYAALSLVSTLLLVVLGRKAPSGKNPRSAFVRPYVDLVRNPRSLAVYLVIFADGMLIVSSFSYLGAYTEYLFHYNYLAIGLVLTAFGFGAIVTGRLVGRVALRIGRTNTLSLGLVAVTAAEAILFSVTVQPVLLVAGIALLGTGFMAAQSTLITIATEFAKTARGTAMSLVAFCFMGGGGIGTAIGSRLIPCCGYARFYGLCGLLLLVLTVVARFAVRDAPARARVAR